MLTGLLLLAAAGTLDDPLAPARAGMLLCFGPRAEKTCSAIGSYRFTGDIFEATLQQRWHTSPETSAIMTLRNRGTVEKGKLCVVVGKESYEAAELVANGAPLDPATVAPIRAQLLEEVASLLGKKGCIALRPGAAGSPGSLEITMDGTRLTGPSDAFIWVKPEDGYKLG